MKKLLMLAALSAAAALPLQAAAKDISRAVPTVEQAVRHNKAPKIAKPAPANQIIAYYSADSERADGPQAGGYYRVLLGHTKDGAAVVQDFYQDSKAKQIDPVAMRKDADPTDFDAESTEGRTIWYSPEGKLTNFADHEKGELVYSVSYVDGKPALEIRKDPRDKNRESQIIYDEHGQVLMEIEETGKGVKTVAYRSNGSKLAETFTPKGGEISHKWWTAAGKETDQESVIGELLTLEKRVRNRMDAISN